MNRDAQYWQVAAGSTGRDYSGLFLKHGMAFVGGAEQVACLMRVQEGDVVVLKQGLSYILAAGRVVSRGGCFKGVDDKRWIRDIDGWDLRAYINVDWVVPARPIKVADDGRLARQTICQLRSEEYRQKADALLRSAPRVFEPEPPEPSLIERGDLVRVVHGLNSSIDPDALDQMLAEIADRDRRYDSFLKLGAEETRDQFVIPLQHALGWTGSDLRPRVSANSARHVLRAFPAESVSAADLRLIDVRPFAEGIDLNADQAAQLGKVFADAQSLAVTNGFAYKLFARREQRGPFDTAPRAYVNLFRPSAKCPWDPSIHGAETVLKWLTKRSA